MHISSSSSVTPTDAERTIESIIVVMGTSGSGKSTVGAQLAARLSLPFVDGDDLHPSTNRAKISRGAPLSDDDRRPWLDAIGRTAAQHARAGLVIACSALRVPHRDRIRTHVAHAFFVHLDVPRSELSSRLLLRVGGERPLSAVDDQLRTLEPLKPHEHGVIVNARGRVDRIVADAERAVRRLHLNATPTSPPLI